MIALAGAPIDQVVTALNNRGITRGRTGDTTGELADYGAAIALPHAPTELVAASLYYRAITNLEAGDRSGAIDDLRRVVGLPDIPPGIRDGAARLLTSLGEAH